MGGIRLLYFVDAKGEERVRISGMNGEAMFTSEGYSNATGPVHAIGVLADAFKSGEVIVDEAGFDPDAPAPDDEETGDEAHGTDEVTETVSELVDEATVSDRRELD